MALSSGSRPLTRGDCSIQGVLFGGSRNSTIWTASTFELSHIGFGRSRSTVALTLGDPLPGQTRSLFTTQVEPSVLHPLGVIPGRSSSAGTSLPHLSRSACSFLELRGSPPSHRVGRCRRSLNGPSGSLEPSCRLSSSSTGLRETLRHHIHAGLWEKDVQNTLTRPLQEGFGDALSPTVLQSKVLIDPLAGGTNVSALSVTPYRRKRWRDGFSEGLTDRLREVLGDVVPSAAAVTFFIDVVDLPRLIDICAHSRLRMLCLPSPEASWMRRLPGLGSRTWHPDAFGSAAAQ